MGRTKTPGILKTDDGYEVDKWHKRIRLRQRGFGNFELAEEWLIAQMARIDRETTEGVRGRRTFEEASIHYMKIYREKPSLESDVYHLKPVMPHIGHLWLEQVHNETLRPFIADRLASGVKSKTVNLSLSLVRNILNLAATDWRDQNGLTWLAQAPRITCLDLDDQRPPRPLAWSEQRRLLPLLPDHLAEMALFMLNTGLRDEPVCNLQWEWEVPIPQLGCSVFIVPKEFVKGTKKSKRERVVVCNSVAQSVIERQRGKHPTHVFVYRRERVKHKDKEPTMPYRPIQTMNNNGWQKARAAAGLGDLHVHDLRHTVGMRLREAEVAESTISEILWHARKSMTQHYSMAQIVEVHRALEEIKDESHQWNVSLQSLVLEARAGRVPQKSPTAAWEKRKTG